MDDDLRRLGWSWLQQTCDGAHDCHPLDACQLWAGHGGGSTPLHFDALNNFVCQLLGRKQVLLRSAASSS